MQLAAHEAHELNELLLSCTNSIQSMALFLNQATDPELRDMIARHYPAHIQDYNMKVEFAKQTMGSRDQLNVPELQMAAGMPPAQQQYPAFQPQVKLSQLDDRSIATSYLLTLKRSGRDYAWGAFECSTPQLRAFLEDAFRMCSHQAYEVWAYMARKGWYPVAMAQPGVMQTLGQIYQEVPYQQPMNVYQ
ncbi:spore coat protein [Gordoniibacillus kamchatkensis]|uniref:Spore coat protein n=1 Tax=Gordoniibacillus kamchatkensis TaxID=1590651 RepID=A0ABR5AII1_9BACL|nr:spore coat protein [Paenibacillus sp. VKM B-2647]KIL40859.1 spore coat protein [Paenibacillus sp. VKM B-2647]